MEQAVQAETIARAAAEKARLTAAALASGNADEAVLSERLASARANWPRPSCAPKWPAPC